MNGFNLLVLEVGTSLCLMEIIPKMRFKLSEKTSWLMIIIIPLVVSNLGIWLTNKNDPDNEYLIGRYMINLITLFVQ